MKENDTPLVENEYVKQLFKLINENGKNTAGLDALLTHIGEMETFVKNAESKILDMKSQLDTMKEIQNHPIKTALKNAIKTLEVKVAEIKTQLNELKSNIVEGCKNAVSEFKTKGIEALNKLASFFRIKSGLEAIKNEVNNSIKDCDKAVSNIESFAKEYHSAGRALKNMVRIAVGMKPLDVKKEAGKLAEVVSVPYKAEKACLNSIKNTIEDAIAKLEQLETVAEVKRGEQTTEKKPKLMERLAKKKEMIKQRELEAPKLKRTPRVQGTEI